MKVTLEPSRDLSDFKVPIAIDLDLATSVKLDDMPVLEQVLGKAVEDVQKRFAKDGFQVFLRAGIVRPMTQEELLSIVPRKVHMSDGEDGWICKTAHVAAKNITNERAEVTCKSCLKVLGAG